MSEIAFCNRGGMDGILTNNTELNEFATNLKKKCLDEVIPLPNMTFKVQKEAIKNCGDNHDDENAQFLV